MVQTWNSAVFIPKTYRETLPGSATDTSSLPVGQEVHTPPCLVQKEQVQARAGISTGSGSHRNSNEMLPQWQLPHMSTGAPKCLRRLTNQGRPPRREAPPAGLRVG